MHGWWHPEGRKPCWRNQGLPRPHQGSTARALGQWAWGLQQDYVWQQLMAKLLLVLVLLQGCCRGDLPPPAAAAAAAAARCCCCSGQRRSLQCCA
eukprot:1152978-Pelagomonas_calceolata.AAC.1